MLWQCETFNNFKLAVVLTFIVSLGTHLFLEEREQALIEACSSWIHKDKYLFQPLLKRLIRKAVRQEDSLFILAYLSPVMEALTMPI